MASGDLLGLGVGSHWTRLTYTVMYLIQVVIFFILGSLHDPWLVGIGFAIVLACYGGGFGVMPSFTRTSLARSTWEIYGFILTAWGFAGLVGPLVAAFVKDRTVRLPARCRGSPSC